MSPTEFVYSTYIKTTPEQLWKALTLPTFTLQYWGADLHSDWQVGSPILWQSGADGAPKDLDQLVLESVPYRRLSYRSHNYQPEHAELFGWTDERFAELVQERRSRVTFDIEPVGSIVKLTVTLTDFEPGSEMLQACSGNKPESGGWPELLGNLKTLLDTGDTLYADAAPTARSDT
jgi:uncharacterized protein YndB with AHSA1/START domain